MQKNGAYYELRRTALEVFKIYFFRLGKRKPVRQLEKTGSPEVMCVIVNHDATVATCTARAEVGHGSCPTNSRLTRCWANVGPPRLGTVGAKVSVSS